MPSTSPTTPSRVTVRAVSHAALALLLTAPFLGVPLARAQVPLLNGFGGAAGYGTSCLYPNDDGSSVAIDLTPAFPSGLRFFDRTHTTAYVNTNGNITFSGGLRTYTPSPFPIASQPMIAPYWADVDIRGEGCALGSGSGAEGCMNPAENGVWWYLEPGRMIVTWDRVGYFGCNADKRMSFQLVLTAASASCGGAGDFDVEFRYNRCEWTTGDASGGTDGFGGTPAQAGFDAGNTRDFVEIMGSRTSSIHSLLCTTSNVSEPGIWRFNIRTGTVLCPDAGRECNTGMMGVCAIGSTQCVGMGTECRPAVTATPERCDALDNDCNGAVDDGENICGPDRICQRGVCMDRCFEGGCNPGQTCTAQGYCVDDACTSTECGPGQRCARGSCVDACSGVVCPAGQACRGGRCADACDGIMCDDCAVCEDGTCVVRCPSRACSSGETCNSEGRCVPSDCATVTCTAGRVCRGGSCIDACEGAVCPTGLACQRGQCIPESEVVHEDGGTATSLDGGGTSGDGDAGPRRVRRPVSTGCAVHASPAPNDGADWNGLYLFGIASLFVVMRRRRRARPTA